MKIVLASPHFPPRFVAGVEQYTLRIARELRRLGHEVEIVCIESISEGSLPPRALTETYDGFAVHRLSFDLSQAPDSFEWRYRNPELGYWFKQYLKRTSPDILHVQSGYLLGGTVLEGGLELGLPVVLTLHDYWFPCPYHTLLRRNGSVCSGVVPVARCVWCLLSEKRRYRLPDRALKGIPGKVFTELSRSNIIAGLLGIRPALAKVIDRQKYLHEVIGKTSFVISPSRFLTRKIQDCGFRPKRMDCLPSGLEDRFTHLSSSRTVSNRFRIGYMGQIEPHKGIDVLLEAFLGLQKRWPSCHLYIHGKLPESPYGRHLLRKGGNHPSITFAGPYQNAEIAKVLSNLDVVVVPSIWPEIRPVVIFEAQAFGIPVVASRAGELPALIEDGRNGLLFEPGSAQELGEKLQHLAEDPALLKTLRDGISPVPTVREEVSTLLSIYRSLLP